MEKLMKYVEEMQKEGISICRPQVQQYDILYMILISKHYPLIKWLVKNDKIDLGKIKKLYRKSNEHSIHTYPIMYEYSDLENLLMLLSISDSPIEDLISYLR